MALPAQPLLALLLALVCLPAPSAATSTSFVGVNYGRLGNNLPPPEAVPHILASIGVGRVRIYDTDPRVLRAFANTGIEIVVGLPDRCLAVMAADANEALTWARANVQAYLPATKIVAVTVGNEVLTNAYDTGFALARALVPAMEALHSALASLSLDHDVAVTTANSLAVLATPSYPPSAAVFRRELLPFLCPLIAFLARTGSPFFVNAYPYFAYEQESSEIALAYARLDPGAPSTTDPGTGLLYTNLLYAQIDAVYHAIAAAGGDAGKRLEVRVSETGWPSAGDPEEIGATPENAGRYSSNLMRLVAQKKGTPLMPGTPLRVYIFALFNENQKPGPTSERNYGLFKANGSPAYHLDIPDPPEEGSSSGGGNIGGGGSSMPMIDGGASSGIFGYTSAARRQWQCQWKTMAVMAAAIAPLILQ